MTLKHNFKKVKASIGKVLGRWRTQKGDIIKEVALSSLGLVQTISPVDSGLFRASHDLTVGEISNYKPTKADIGEGQGSSEVSTQFDEASRRLDEADGRAIEKGEVRIFMTSNLSYAQALEDGHSPQAPSPPGIYAQAREHARRKYEEAGIRRRL